MTEIGIDARDVQSANVALPRLFQDWPEQHSTFIIASDDGQRRCGSCQQDGIAARLYRSIRSRNGFVALAQLG